MCKNFYGLTYEHIKVRAYKLTIANDLEIPAQWHVDNKAGKFWLLGFMKRHKEDLSLRTPEGFSLSRAISFNFNNVELFYDDLKKILERYPAFKDGSRNFNLDESGTTTVPDCFKVVAAKGSTKVNSMTSGERGTLVTTCCVIGNFLPPVMVFPRTHFKGYMLSEGFPGTLGLATPSGWMNQELFIL
ncbi:hypothetical protein M8J76_003005 [Diaphorina citri]|nr:hypothetical protein M8J75_005089 [Diaphorina citri]KAI5723210.1 hypothetical protein M8J76_003005 [Diaphorina citri]KAI5728854.1 hypothetical protein M8J77_022305 [Diaphorina citri]